MRHPAEHTCMQEINGKRCGRGYWRLSPLPYCDRCWKAELVRLGISKKRRTPAKREDEIEKREDHDRRALDP